MNVLKFVYMVTKVLDHSLCSLQLISKFNLLRICLVFLPSLESNFHGMVIVIFDSGEGKTLTSQEVSEQIGPLHV